MSLMDFSTGEILAILATLLTLAGVIWRGSAVISSLKTEMKEIKSDLHDIDTRLKASDERRVLRGGEVSAIREMLAEINATLRLNFRQLSEQARENKQEVAKNRESLADIFKNYDLRKRNGGNGGKKE